MVEPAYSLYRQPIDRVPVPVIAIQGRTLLWCKKDGSIMKFETPNLLIFSSGGVYTIVRHHEKTIKKPWQFKYYLKMVWFGCAKALEGLSSIPDSKQGCLPALYGDGKGWLRWISEGKPTRMRRLCLTNYVIVFVRLWEVVSSHSQQGLTL